MKKLIIISSLLLTTASSYASTVKGTEARSIMEALSASGFEFENNSGEWAGKMLIIKTGAITCHYTAISPDEWMTNITCNKGATLEEHHFDQSLALAKSILNYANQEAGMGNRWLSVNSITCSLKYDEKEYLCQIETEF